MNVAQRRLQRRQVVMNLNPLRADPTQTATLRRLFVSRFRGRFQALRRKVLALVVEEDAFGLRGPSMPRVVREGPTVRRVVGAPVANQRWQFRTEAQKLEAFQVWLAEQIQQEIFQTTLERIEDAYWTEYIRQAYFKGAGRAFDDTKPPKRPLPEGSVSDFYKGSRSEFLRSSFANPQSVEKVKLLAARVYSDLNGVTQTMATQMSRILVDGFARGESPRKIGDSLSKAISSIGEVRAATIARTEVIRAHAEGQLDSLERLGVTKVGVMVEWSIAPDGRLCDLCAAMGGTVMTIQEARGMIPRHPNCRCAFVPANVGEDTKGQVRSKTALEKARDESIRREIPKRSNRSLKDQKKLSKWAGADTTFQKDRPDHKFAPVEKPPEGKKVKPKPKPKKEPKPKPKKEPKPVPAATAPPKATKPKPKAEPKPKKVKYKTFEEGLKGILASEHLDDLHKKFLDSSNQYYEGLGKLFDEKSDIRAKIDELGGKVAQAFTDFQEKKITQAVLDKRIAGFRDEQLKLTESLDAVQKKIDEVKATANARLFKTIAVPEEDRAVIQLLRPNSIETTASNGRTIDTLGKADQAHNEPQFRKNAEAAKNFLESLASKKNYRYGVITNLHRLPDGERAFARNAHTIQGGVFLESGDTVATHVHELGHILEYRAQNGAKIAEGFRKYRIAKAGTKDVKMAEQFPNYRYDPWEVGNKDDFDKLWPTGTSAYYAGKGYGGRATEIISMGVEQLYKDPVAFAEKDPEYFKFVIGFIRGDFNEIGDLP